MTGQRTVDLHDQQSLIDADTAALLPSAALAGAQVRSGAEQVAALAPFDRPRALVVVGASAALDTALLTALIGDRSAAPVVASPPLPAPLCSTHSSRSPKHWLRPAGSPCWPPSRPPPACTRDPTSRPPPNNSTRWCRSSTTAGR